MFKMHICIVFVLVCFQCSVLYEYRMRSVAMVTQSLFALVYLSSPALVSSTFSYVFLLNSYRDDE